MELDLLNKIEKALEGNPEGTLREIAEEVGCSPSSVHKCKQLIKLQETSDEEKNEVGAVDLALKRQKLMDSNRVERALFRSEARKLNERNELFEKMIEMLKGKAFDLPQQINTASDGPVLLVCFNDTHFGEQVALKNNIVNTKVISQRLHKYVSKAIQGGLAFDCKRVIFLMLGDMINSARRPSEYLSNEFTTSHATINAIEIISQTLNLISSHFSLTDVVSVLGNESTIRMSDNQFGFEAKMLMSNFDYIIHESLRQLFPSVKFSEWGNPLERIISLHNRNILLTHGITAARKSPEHQLIYYKTKYGHDIHYVIEGHVHESCITPFMARAGSPVGANCFSELSLAIPVSIPSQTYHIVDASGITSIPVDLSFGYEEYFNYTTPPKEEALIDTFLSL